MPDNYFNTIDAPIEELNENSEQNLDAKVDELISKGYFLEYQLYIRAAFEIFSQNAGIFISFSVVFFGVNIIVLALQNIQLIPSLIASAFNPAYIIGLTMVVRKIMAGKEVNRNDLLQGFSFFKPLFIRSILVSLVLSIGTMLVLLYANGGGNILEMNQNEIMEKMMQNPEQVNGFALLIIFAPFLYLSIAWQYADMFIVYGGKSFWEAMETSRKLITRKWFSFFAFFLIIAILNVIGAFLFLIGLVVTVPVSIIAIYLSFDRLLLTNKSNN